MPKVKFKYSHIYDRGWKDWIKVYKKIKPQDLSAEEVLNYIKEIEPLWRKEEKRICSELAKITGLKWRDKEIVCYVVGDCRPFSDPLTLPAYRNREFFIDVLTHELIHQLFVQADNTEKAWQRIHRKYKKESFITRIHIPLHAIHWHIYAKFFGEERLQLDISKASKFPEYKRAWEIVKKEGHEKIIREFRKK
jgi:hypothetical protein